MDQRQTTDPKCPICQGLIGDFSGTTGMRSGARINNNVLGSSRS